MPKGHKACKWLTLTSIELCGKSCLRDFCKIHLARLRKGSCTQPCKICGVGVTNKQRFCVGCGYRNAWKRDKRGVQREFTRLAVIQITI